MTAESIDCLWPFGLTERQQLVLNLRFDRTLESIAQDIQLTRERVRQIEKHARIQLRTRVVVQLKNMVAALQEELSVAPAINDDMVADHILTANPSRARIVLDVLGVAPLVIWRKPVPGWWSDNPVRLGALVETVAAAAPFPNSELDERSRAIGIPAEFPVDNVLGLDSSPIRQHPVGPWWVRRSAVNRDGAYLWLANLGESQPLAAMANYFGRDEHAMRELMRRDARFVQLRPAGTWALAEWSRAEIGYRTALEAVLGILEDRGPMEYRDLVRAMESVYPVSLARIAQTMTSALIGRLPDGRVGLVRDGAVMMSEEKPVTPDTVAVSGDKLLLAARIGVDRNLLRGSGIALPRYVSWHLGLHHAPASRSFRVAGTSDTVIVNKFLAGAAASSLRKFAQALAVVEGCVIILMLYLRDDTAKLVHGCPEGQCPARDATRVRP